MSQQLLHQQVNMYFPRILYQYYGYYLPIIPWWVLCNITYLEYYGYYLPIIVQLYIIIPILWLVGGFNHLNHELWVLYQFSLVNRPWKISIVTEVSTPAGPVHLDRGAWYPASAPRATGCGNKITWLWWDNGDIYI